MRAEPERKAGELYTFELDLLYESEVAQNLKVLEALQGAGFEMSMTTTPDEKLVNRFNSKVTTDPDSFGAMIHLRHFARSAMESHPMVYLKGKEVVTSEQLNSFDFWVEVGLERIKRQKEEGSTFFNPGIPFAEERQEHNQRIRRAEQEVKRAEDRLRRTQYEFLV